MLAKPFQRARYCAEHFHMVSHLIPTTTHFLDEETVARTGEITFPSDLLGSGRARFQIQICDQRLAGT